MKFDTFDGWLSAAKDWHLPICTSVWALGAIMQWFRHLDPTFVAFTGTVLAAITGHAFSPARRDDGK